jgi:heavy metal efflux system protein
MSMDALIRWALRYRHLSLLLAAILMLAGVQAWQQLPIDAFPDISPTQAKIILKIPGMTPEEVEQRVVKPIEQELLSIPKKRMVRSVSKYGIADITLDFDEGVDIYWARQQVSERLNGVMGDLPAGVSGGLAPITTPLSELYMFTVEGENFSLADKRRVLDWTIRPELRTIAGVAEVNALGGEVQTFEVLPKTERMAALGVSMASLREALADNNSNDGAGRMTAGEESLVVRVEGAVKTLDDLRAIRIEQPRSGQKILLDDVAVVRQGALTRYGAVTQDGRGEAVEGLVLGLRGVNARELVDAIDQKIHDLQKRLPEGMAIKTFYNRGELVSRAANTVIKALAEAAVLVCVVLYVFLGGLRPALVVAVSLPLSLLATFLLMRYTGITANLMSLGGLAIALGMLVDASVVVVENVETQLAHGPQGHDVTLTERVLHAVREVLKPVGAGVLIICVVFLPLLTLQGLEGKLFSPVALTIIMALSASLLLAFTVVPALASLVLKPQAAHEPWVMVQLLRTYVKWRDASWRHPRWLVGVALASLVLAAGLYTQIGKTFMPTLDEGDILVQLQKTASISLEASMDIDTRVQQAILAKVPEVKSVIARVGSDELGLDPMGLNETDTFLVLKPKSEWRGSKEDIISALRDVLEGFPGLVYGFTQPIEMRISEMLTGTRGDVAIKLFGSDLAQLSKTAQQVADAVRKTPGAAEVIAPKAEGMQYLSVRMNRHTVGQAGMSVAQVQQALRQQLEGETVGHVLDRGIRTALTLRGNDTVRSSPEALRNLPITAPDGKAWPASALADIQAVDGPIRIDHELSQRLTTIQVAVEGRDLTGFVADAQQAVAALGLPKDIQVVWGGQFENQQRAAARLSVVIPAAMGLIFLILTFTFGSVVQAGIIFLNIPFALVGGVVALAVSGQYLSVPASVGFIALLGIAVLNGVVMVTHFNERLQNGEALAQVVRLGAERRLRPVLMTALITALGMIPLLFATGPGSEIQKPLAIVVTGGLISSTALTLLLLPLIFERWGALGSLADVWAQIRRPQHRSAS